MQLPIQFKNSSGSCDFITPVVNFTGNALVVAVGGISVGTITYIGLIALGFTKIAAGVAAAIPVALGAIGAVATIIGTGILVILGIIIYRTLNNR